MIVSAYDKNDKLIEGEVLETSSGKRYVMHEGKMVDINGLNYTRFIEDSEEVDKKVADDVSHLSDDSLKNVKEEDLQKAGEEREKELKDAGMKMDDNEYSTKFVVAAGAKAAEAGGGVDPTKADINNSKALEGLTESEEKVSVLPEDYQDVELYDDAKTREQIYVDLSNEIKDYSEKNKKFDDEELLETICNKYLNGNQVRGKTLKESFAKIVNLTALKEFTATQFEVCKKRKAHIYT